jgi:glyoxylase-like metal-dependent hydrolase (beta-lactamase superfamily II)
MAKLEQVTDEIYRLGEQIPGANAVFAVYFIKDGDGAILEPGPAVLVPSIQEAVAELGLSKPGYIIPTHIHLDHAGGVGRLAEVFPNTKIVVNKQGARHIVEPSRLIKSTRMAFGDGFESTYGPILAVSWLLSTPPVMPLTIYLSLILGRGGFFAVRRSD